MQLIQYPPPHSTETSSVALDLEVLIGIFRSLPFSVCQCDDLIISKRPQILKAIVGAIFDTDGIKRE